MNKLVCGSATLLIFLSICINKGGAILCWDCNSALDPRCGEHGFDDYTLGFVDCDQLNREHLKAYSPKYCRKIIQNIGTQKRTIRGCGWLEDKKASQNGGCYSRTGTKDITVTFCQCEEDKCNAASSFFRGNLGLLTVPLFILVKLF